MKGNISSGLRYIPTIALKSDATVAPCWDIPRLNDLPNDIIRELVVCSSGAEVLA